VRRIFGESNDRRFAAALAVFGCVRDLSPDTYSPDEVGSKVNIQEAHVISVHDVRIECTRPSVVAVAGAAAGGNGGSYAGGGRGGSISPIAGRMIGDLLGAAMEDAVTGSEGAACLVEIENGEAVTAVQPKGGAFLKPGGSALLVFGHHIRVVPAEAQGDVRLNDVREYALEPCESWSRKEAEA